jgi:hypothetical protein
MDDLPDLAEPTLWRRFGWTARVIPNLDGDGGWAVEMTRHGDPEPALVGPWTMGRDKKNPKPLDHHAFNTLVKTANEILARHEQHARSLTHKHFVYTRDDGQRLAVDFDVAGTDDDPHAVLTVTDDITGDPVRTGRVGLRFRLNASNVERFLDGIEG